MLRLSTALMVRQEAEKGLSYILYNMNCMYKEKAKVQPRLLDK